MHPVSCLTTPPPPSRLRCGPSGSCPEHAQRNPLSDTGNRVDDALRQPPMLGCVCDERGADVAASVKDQIWRGDFVRLGVLIRKDPGFGEETQASVCLTSARSSLLLRPQSKNTCHLFNRTIDVAFPYSIILERHPSRARELVKLMDIVRSITRFGGYNWRPYDVQ